MKDVINFKQLIIFIIFLILSLSGCSSGGGDGASVPNIVSDTCAVPDASGGCLSNVYIYSNGLISGVTSYIYVKNIGGAGTIDATVSAGGYTETKQFAVDAGARYELRSVIRATIPPGNDSLEVTASLQGFSTTKNIGPIIGSINNYEFVPNGPASSSLVLVESTGESGIQAALVGSWSAGCEITVNLDRVEEFITISGSSFSTTYNVWSGRDCLGIPEVSKNISGTFTLGDEVTVMLGYPVIATKIDYEASTALFTLYTANAVTEANTTGFCGATDWVVGTAKEVVGTDCMPASFKDIVYIDDTVDPDLMYDGDTGAQGPDVYPALFAVNAKARLTVHTVSGTVTLPDSVIGKQWYVAIDDDHDMNNGTIAIASGVITGSTFNYSLDYVPPGDYFIYGEVDMTGTLGPWSAGDYVGVGCGTTDTPCKVTVDLSKMVDFSLAVIPSIELLLDGVDDKAEATTTIFPDTNTAQSFTVEAWIYPTAAGAYIAIDDTYALILFYDPAENNNGVGIKFGLASDCSSLVEATEFRDVTLNQWNHVAAMFDASAQHFTISINGILSSSPVSFTAGTFCSDPAEQYKFTVGGNYWGDTETFQGRIDEVRISDNVRYTTYFTPLIYFIPDSNTKGLWHFDESPGSTSFSDSSGNGNTLTGLNGAQTN